VTKSRKILLKKYLIRTGETRYLYTIRIENLKGGDEREVPGIYWRITLKWILNQ
jgi:hypothetical protein